MLVRKIVCVPAVQTVDTDYTRNSAAARGGSASGFSMAVRVTSEVDDDMNTWFTLQSPMGASHEGKAVGLDEATGEPPQVQFYNMMWRRWLRLSSPATLDGLSGQEAKNGYYVDAALLSDSLWNIAPFHAPRLSAPAPSGTPPALHLAQSIYVDMVSSRVPHLNPVLGTRMALTMDTSMRRRKGLQLSDVVCAPLPACLPAA